ncbi:kinesin-like protein, putative [Bodo saltans]|uniref:Kinesin-like protein, putative n=1 Tax=Bodo saltans TaxID=75058 RepID=A0A0S4J5P7_BODSA|nr:kinesin-like protein, putative [Bodo saltans]|eukprot:CUG83076.1 kinesin-like protein, putative [Bodo saltans]
MIVTLRCKFVGATDRLAYLNVVDLAGCENASTSAQLSETIAINTSLSSLATLFRNMVDEGASFSPRRRHTHGNPLIQVLKESLTGRSHLSLILCVVPSMEHQNYASSTLQFGALCLKLKLQPESFQLQSSLRCTCVELKATVERLKEELRNAHPRRDELQMILLDSLDGTDQSDGVLIPTQVPQMVDLIGIKSLIHQLEHVDVWQWEEDTGYAMERLRRIFPRRHQELWHVSTLSTLLAVARCSSTLDEISAARVADRVEFERDELVRLLREYVETLSQPPPVATPQLPPEAAQPVLRCHTSLEQLIRLLPTHDASAQFSLIRNAYDLNRDQSVGDEECKILLSFVKETEDHDALLEAILSTMHIIPVERMQSNHISMIVDAIARIAAPLVSNSDDQRLFNSARDRLLALCNVITGLCHNGPASTRTLMVTSRIAKHLISILVASSIFGDRSVLEALSAMSNALDLDNQATLGTDLPADVTRTLLGSILGIIKSCITWSGWLNVVEAAADLLEKLSRTYARTMTTLAASEDLLQTLCDIVSTPHNKPQIRRILSSVLSSIISNEVASNFPKDGRLAKSLLTAVAHVARWSIVTNMFDIRTAHYSLLDPYPLHCHSFKKPLPSCTMRQVGCQRYLVRTDHSCQMVATVEALHADDSHATTKLSLSLSVVHVQGSRAGVLRSQEITDATQSVRSIEFRGEPGASYAIIVSTEGELFVPYALSICSHGPFEAVEATNEHSTVHAVLPTTTATNELQLRRSRIFTPTLPTPRNDGQSTATNEPKLRHNFSGTSVPPTPRDDGRTTPGSPLASHERVLAQPQESAESTNIAVATPTPSPPEQVVQLLQPLVTPHQSDREVVESVAPKTRVKSKNCCLMM